MPGGAGCGRAGCLSPEYFCRISGLKCPSPADTAVLVLNPAFHPDNTLVLCDLANPSLISFTVQDPQIEFISSPAISRLAETLGTGAGPDSLVDSSSGSSFNYAALAGGLAAAAAVAVAVGGWYARRRWLR